MSALSCLHLDKVTAPGGRALVRDIAATKGEIVAAFASDLLQGDRRQPAIMIVAEHSSLAKLAAI